MLSLNTGDPKVFERIEEQLRKSFPDIENLVTPLIPRGSGTVLGIREKWFGQVSSGAQLSDGLVGFLAHLVPLYGPDEPTLVVFEEPENYIHPRLMERLVKMLKSAATDTQVLITTHSTTLLNWLQLEDILIVERPEGGTTLRRAVDDEDLRDALKDWALGDAYAAGVLGGVP